MDKEKHTTTTFCGLDKISKRIHDPHFKDLEELNDNFGLSGRNVGNNYLNKASFVLSLSGGCGGNTQEAELSCPNLITQRLLNLFGDISLHHGITPGTADQTVEETYR